VLVRLNTTQIQKVWESLGKVTNAWVY